MRLEARIGANGPHEKKPDPPTYKLQDKGGREGATGYAAVVGKACILVDVAGLVPRHGVESARKRPQE
jgi:hypothetical protein